MPGTFKTRIRGWEDGCPFSDAEEGWRKGSLRRKNAQHKGGKEENNYEGEDIHA